MKIEKIYKGLIDIYTSNLNESFLLAMCVGLAK